MNSGQGQACLHLLTKCLYSQLTHWLSICGHAWSWEASSPLSVASVYWSLPVVSLLCKQEKVQCVQGWGPSSPLHAVEQRTEGLP